MAHQHPVKDTDLHFVIDPVTRVIKNNSGKIVIMQHDHQSEILTFELPRYIDTHDMSLSNTVRVHYINIGSSSKYEPVSGVYEITDLQIDPENENLVTCSWTLTNNTTQLEGTLNFIIRFSCLTGDTIDYSWSTAIYSGIIVAKTIDSSDYVMTAIPDILEQWKASLKGDPFTYEDFTPEQLEGLRGLRGPAGIIISETEPTNEDHPVWVRPSGEYIVENLGISGAAVGQTVKIKAVGENGAPTEWEAVDMPSGGEREWIKIGEVTNAEDTTNPLYIRFTKDINGNSLSLKGVIIIGTPLFSDTNTHLCLLMCNDNPDISNANYFLYKSILRNKQTFSIYSEFLRGDGVNSVGVTVSNAGNVKQYGGAESSINIWLPPNENSVQFPMRGIDFRVIDSGLLAGSKFEFWGVKA